MNQKTIRLFGKPIAVVRDMGDGCARSVESLIKACVPDLVCHYHFLAAVGKKLFGKQHDLLRNKIRKTRCMADLRTLLKDLSTHSSTAEKKGRFGKGTIRDSLKALVSFIIEGDGKSDAPFPFSLPHLGFAQRYQQAERYKAAWILWPLNAPERRAIACFDRITARMNCNPTIKDDYATIVLQKGNGHVISE